MERLYANALGSAAAIVAYSRHEADAARRAGCASGASRSRVEFVPVRRRRRRVPAGERAVRRRRRLDRGGSAPRLRAAARGRADAARDELPRRHDAPSAHARSPPGRRTSPSRPTCRSTRCADRLERARVVALPVRDNSYSGATTVLLQAMALGKPVVVTRTAAIATGYGLEDGANVPCSSPPGDAAALRRARSRSCSTTTSRAARARRCERGRRSRRSAHVGPVRERDPADSSSTAAALRPGVSVSPCSPGAIAARGAPPGRRRHAARRHRGRRPCARARGAADLALFHEFAPPPTGGGHQFLRALVRELERRGLEVELTASRAGRRPASSTRSTSTSRRLRRFAGRGARMVHRVDGPIGVYRGFDDGTDERIAADQRRARGRDDPPVALHPREAPSSSGSSCATRS